ncbi:hypothetical protein Pint_33976 [Pistacia integerrima]|uniref:Uncharacterized protein n=1 Tax=Pistacia integerrima TaxID=434235 RepID=A0ACC0X7X2_9ROSI|nr:hypothetical protein Pint_33976 [Pistacia integerrima]
MDDSPLPVTIGNTGSGEIYLPEGDLSDLEPYEGMEFESEEAAKAFYNSYARRVGFSTRVSSSRRSRRDGAIIQRQFVCAKEGFRNLNEKRTKDREIKRPRTVTRVGCKASLSVKMQDSGKWVVSGFVKEHNHELVPPDQVHCLRSHRQISGPAKTLIDTLQAAGMGPLLKTPSPMERQASELYTRKLFMRFQEELVGTLTFTASKADDDGEIITYQVAKFGEDHKAYYVKFNVLEMKASCSCQMFEFSGLLCRHILAVFRVTNVLTLPSHYILKRWTRNAKSSVILEERANDVYTNYLESHTVRYNTLRHEVFKFIDEGAQSVDTYNVAMIALQDAAKRVAVATKNDGKTTLMNGRMRTKTEANRAISINANYQVVSSQPLSESDDFVPSTYKTLKANVALIKNLSNGIIELSFRFALHHLSFSPISYMDMASESLLMLYCCISCHDDMDKKIRELTNELEFASRKCEVYRANLLSVLKDIEDHKLQLSIKVQNIKISMKDSL